MKNHPMKFNVLASFMICLLFNSCQYKSETVTKTSTETNPVNYVLNFENDSCKIAIKEVNKSDFASFRNGYHTEPYLGMKADCISLKELLRIVKNTETSSVILNDEDLKNQYYGVLISQKVISSTQDSTIKSNIIESLNVKIEKKVVNIDTIMTSVADKVKYLKYANTTISDTIKTQHRNSQDSMTFENFELTKILAALSKEFDKTLYLQVEEPQRINIKIHKTDWNSAKAELESDLGLVFNTKTTQAERYIVRKNNFVEKN